MTDYQALYNDYLSLRIKLRSALVNNIIDFVQRYGKNKKNEVSLSFNQDIEQILDSVQLLVMIDRNLCEYGFRSLNEITLKYPEKELFFHTEIGFVTFEELSMSELLAIDEYLDWIEMELVSDFPDFVITDGEVLLTD